MDRNEYLDNYGLQVDPLFDKIDALEQENQRLRDALLDAADLIDYYTKDSQGVTDGSEYRDLAQNKE